MILDWKLTNAEESFFSRSVDSRILFLDKGDQVLKIYCCDHAKKKNSKKRRFAKLNFH